MSSVDSNYRQFGQNWGWMLAYGILLIIVGIFALMDPLATGLAVGIILGISFLIGGFGSLFAAFRDAGWQARAVDILFGILSLLAGIICLFNPFSGAVSLVWVIGVMFLFMGGFEFVAGLRTGNQRYWLILLGVFDMLIGFWVTFLMPAAAALVALAALVGLAFMLRGLLLSVLSFRLRKMAGN